MSNIRVLYIQNPPANTLSFAILTELRNDLEKAFRDDTVDAILITGDEKLFSSGADLKVLDANYVRLGPKQSTEAYINAYKTGENLAPFVYELDQALKPIIALISGVCYGGGFEVALGCHYRICTSTAIFRLPEVLVGIIPGALGTQYLPRITNYRTAIELAVFAKQMDSKYALKNGLVDEMLSGWDGKNYGEAVEKAVLSIQHILDNPTLKAEKFRQTSRMSVKVSIGDAFAMNARVLQSLPPANKGTQAQRAVLECLLGCVKAGQAFVKGVVWESEISRYIVATREAHALRYVFLAEKATNISSSLPSQLLPTIRNVGVIGAGVMGIGIASSLVQAGYKVTVIDASEEALERARKSLLNIITSALKKQKGTTSDSLISEIMQSVHFSTQYEDLALCHLVIEAVFENLKVKQEVFEKLGQICCTECILCTNTSSLSIHMITAKCSHLERVAGMHFFSPAHIMKLVEIVYSPSTSTSVMEILSGVVRRMNKTGVIVKDLPGFVGNRMVFNYILESMLLLEEGVSVAHIDKLMVGFGFPMGPFQMQDLSGLDVGYLIRKEAGLLEYDGDYRNGSTRRYSSVGDELYKQGRLGCKNGKGFYKYEATNPRAPIYDPIVDEFITGRMQQSPSSPLQDIDIVERLLCILINEAFKILADRGVNRPGDIDVVYILGYGWPPYKGGVLFYGQSFLGLQNVLKTLMHYANKWPQSIYFHPSLLLRLVVERNISIFSLQNDPQLLDSLINELPTSSLDRIKLEEELIMKPVSKL